MKFLVKTKDINVIEYILESKYIENLSYIHYYINLPKLLVTELVPNSLDEVF